MYLYLWRYFLTRREFIRFMCYTFAVNFFRYRKLFQYKLPLSTDKTITDEDINIHVVFTYTMNCVYRLLE